MKLKWLAAILALPLIAAAADSLPKIPPVDWSTIHPSDLTDDELDLPFFIEHFHDVANAVVDSGPTRGFLNIGVWRGKLIKPFNARVMENHLSLAFFYCTNRPWNPYYASPAVRARLEAMLNYWCSIQSPDGEFSEYGPNLWNLPATAFSTKFMGRTLTLLHNGPPIDPDLLNRITAADRKAIIATLTLPDLYRHGEEFTNQFCNVFAGAEEYMALHPDPQIAALVDKVFHQSAKDFQSPAGFFYERNGADFGYTLYTHASDQAACYQYVRGTELGALIEQQETRWVDWLSYNLVREPDGSTFVINRCIESRQLHADWSREDTPIAQAVPLARAFASSIEERQQYAATTRPYVIANWGKPTTLQLLTSSYSPYNFLLRDNNSWYPTDAQRSAAIAQLPYLAHDTFTHQRADSRTPLVCTFIRRPTYYAIFDAGTKLNPQQRYGLGLLWNPHTGTVLQSQTATSDAAWGTRPVGARSPIEARDLSAQYLINDQEIDPSPGARDLAPGTLIVRYQPDADSQKFLRFDNDNITVSVHSPGPFTEQLPLLTPTDAVNLSPGIATVDYGGITFTIDFDPSITAKVQTTKTIIAQKHLTILQLAATDLLVYHLHFSQ